MLNALHKILHRVNIQVRTLHFRLYERWQILSWLSRLVIFSAVSVLTIYCLCLISQIKGAHITSTHWSSDGVIYESVNLPFTRYYTGDYWVKLKVLNGHTDTPLKVYPDDQLLALSVNGKAYDLSHFSLRQLRNFSQGMAINIDFSSEDELIFKLKNHSNPASFNVDISSKMTLLQGTMLWLIMAVYAVFLSLSIRIYLSQLAIAIFSFLLCVMYLSVTDERERIFDVYEGGGHKDYIEYVADNWALPNPSDGWEYHQPPLYYGVAATVKTYLLPNNINNGDLWARILALWFWVVFVITALGALKGGVGNYTILNIASLLLSFWPAGIIHSVRIGNDLPLYALSILSFYFTLKWWRSKQTIYIFWASFWMFLAVLTKSNGLILTAILLGLLGILAIQPILTLRKTKEILALYYRPLCVVAAFAVLGIAVNLGDNIYKYTIGEADDWLLANVGTTINPGLRVDNSLLNYIIFDLKTFLTSPFISTWSDEYGRQYFWNFLLRSSLTSEYFFDASWMTAWGVFNGILLLLMLATLGYCALKTIDDVGWPLIAKSIYKSLPWHLLWVLSLIFLLAYRIKVPLSCNTDFRYIYPLLLSFVYFSSRIASTHGRLSTITIGCMTAFPVSTLVWLTLLVKA
ncbi:hypothetical protein [Marinagarivorans algicola]|uniref:hypothetical protein n=1 Tax=Marinagarivorans algicola TaxID=1513270 RepID=UPI0006B6614D|nr:hypothetical protein [Marinagarivorans algicola]